MIKTPTAIIICKTPGCEEEIQPNRAALGYKTCIYCGSPINKYTVAIPYNKGTYQLIPESEINCIGRK